jgi:glycerol-3-phosphate dehydrogenase
MTATPLTAEAREKALARLSASVEPGGELDVLVIGGGVTGAGIALDAASRGLTTAVVEAQDWASGTSSRSSKLVHGGLRYLQMLDFKLVREALTERDLLLTRLAPHLVRPMPFLYPLRHAVWERAFIGAGIALYDTLASVSRGKRAVPWHRHLGRKRLARDFPGLAPQAAVGAIEYWDATVDDARYVLSVLRTAVAHGAVAASRTQVVSLTTDESGRVNGAVLADLETGATFPVRARTVIASTGAWTERTQALADAGDGLRVLASKGIHIVVPRERIQGTPGLILQTEKSVLFVIPWSRYWVIGTTDTPWTEDLVDPVPTAADIDYVLEKANAVLAAPLDRSDVIGTWAGLRPLLQPGTGQGLTSAKVSREHTVASPAPGFVVIAGGKFTTYRVMAQDAVDFALGAAAAATPSITADIPLTGAVGLAAARRELEAAARAHGWTTTLVDHLLHRYGANVRDLIALCEDDADLAERVSGAPDYLRAEIHYAVSHEGALHLEDIIERRTRITYEYAGTGMAALDDIAAVAGDVLGWSPEVRRTEVERYRQRAEAEIAATGQPDDESAARVRATAEPIAPWSDDPAARPAR